MRLKHGTIREDGMIFWGYQKEQEYWVVPEKYAHMVERKRASGAAWAKAHPEKGRARSDAWRKAHPERHRATVAARYRSHPEKHRAAAAAWRTANPEKAQAACAAWAKANPDKTTRKTARRRALKLAAVPDDANAAFVTGLYVIAQRVSKCLGIPHDVDHIVPLSLGGSHCHRNLQVIPSTWNRRKQDRYDYRLPDCYRTNGWMIV